MKTKAYIFFIVLVSLCLCVSIGFNIYNMYGNSTNLELYNELGGEFSIKLESVGAKSSSISMYGDMIITKTTKQKISIVLPDVEMSGKKLYIKVEILSCKLGIDGFNDWLLQEDSSYLYNSQLMANQTVGVSTNLVFPEDIVLKPTKIYTINILVVLS